MKIGKWAGLLLVAAPLLTGCSDFWQSSSSASFTLTNSGNVTVTPGSSGAATITVTPGSSFSGTVSLTCAITTSPSGATDPATCGLSSSSLTFSSTTAQTSTLTATTKSTTTAGAYDITITGVSGSLTETTTVCVEVSSSGSCSSASGTSGNFYLLNDGKTNGSTPEIVGKSIKSGALSAISGSPWALSSVGTPYSAVVAPNGKFLLVSTSNGVYTYLIKSGTLDAPVLVSPDEAYAIQIDSTSSWLIEAIGTTTGSVTLNAIPIDPTTGKYTSATTHSVTFSVTNAAVQPNRMVISRDNPKVFAALGEGGTIVVPFDSGTPFPNGVSATKIPVVNPSYGSALSVAVDPKSRLFYIGETAVFSSGTSTGTATSGGLRALTYASSSSSSPVSVSEIPIASGGLAPNFILPEASGNYVYVANGNGQKTGNITGFKITRNSDATYAISAGSTVEAAVQPVGLAEDSNDTYILAVSETQSPYLEAYTFDSTTGELSSQITSSDTSYASIAIAAAP